MQSWEPERERTSRLARRLLAAGAVLVLVAATWGLSRGSVPDWLLRLAGSPLSAAQQSAALTRLDRDLNSGELRVTLWNVPADQLQQARLDRSLAKLWIELGLVRDEQALKFARPRHELNGLRLGPVIDFQGDPAEPTTGTYGESVQVSGAVPRTRIRSGLLAQLGPQFDWGTGPDRPRLRLDFGPDPASGDPSEFWELAEGGQRWTPSP